MGRIWSPRSLLYLAGGLCDSGIGAWSIVDNRSSFRWSTDRCVFSPPSANVQHEAVVELRGDAAGSGVVAASVSSSPSAIVLPLCLCQQW